MFTTPPIPMVISSPQTYTESWLPGYDGTQFYTRTYASDRPRAVLLFVHGLFDHVARYDWAHAHCAAKGVNVFTFDLRGFGRTALDTAHKSATSSYGCTNLHAQLSDMEWWVKHIHREYPNLPIFTMGHSMGGALILGFATRTASSPPPSQDSIALISGVIPSSTLLLQHVHRTKIIRWIAMRLRATFPNLPYIVSLPINYMSHDPAIGPALASDPLVIPRASITCLTDMLNNGEALYEGEYRDWPKKLPVLFVQGTADKVTSFEAAKEFYENLPADDKRFITIQVCDSSSQQHTQSLNTSAQDAYHELVNEPNGVKEKYMDDVIAWILEHSP
ncbi:lysophospholipase [Lenzites betulinus]|nr:lysophospholipase [Lenzites betulinus]